MREVVVGIVEQGREEKLRHYVRAVEATGAAYEVLPWSSDPVRDAGRFDALVLCGGDDVDAAHFGEANHPKVETVPPQRDAYELRLVREARARGTPLLGVCRGGQVLNVALGGTLIQHVPDLPRVLVHQDGARHPVEVLPGTRLAEVAGAAAREVNSYHHQAVGRVAPVLCVAARSEDGIVEAVEDPAAPFLLGVQWHPERGGNEEPLGQGLFDALVQAARRRAAGGAAAPAGNAGPAGGV